MPFCTFQLPSFFLLFAFWWMRPSHGTPALSYSIGPAGLAVALWLAGDKDELDPGAVSDDVAFKGEVFGGVGIYTNGGGGGGAGFSAFTVGRAGEAASTAGAVGFTKGRIFSSIFGAAASGSLLARAD